MESLTLSDGLVSSRNPDRKHRERKNRNLRLPTPSTSCGSSDSNDESRGLEKMRNNRPTFDILLRSSPEVPNGKQEASVVEVRVKDDPETPPLQPSDPFKLSLPPMKSLINGNLSSPPNTPRRQGAHLPPLLEPDYLATYKPTSLYPFKKQRMNSDTPPEFSENPSTSPRNSTGHFPSQSTFSPNRPRFENPDHDASTTYRHRRQDSTMMMNEPQGLTNTNNNTTNLPYRNTPEQRSLSSNFNHTLPQPNNVNNSNNVPSISTVQNSPGPPHWYPHQAENHQHVSDRSTIRRTPNLRSVRSFDSSFFSHQHQSRQRHRTPSRDCYGRSDLNANAPGSGGSAFSHMRYDSNGQNGGMYMSASAYDFGHGKSRKRGNLPKQSTEIMKTWFDENISNPYPSEEQKAVFARATGVSMTQVSNWFINHRRRCPELREKRTGKCRTAGSGKESET